MSKWGNMQFDGYGYEFDATYIGGPADGLESSVVVLNSKEPPKFRCLEPFDCTAAKVPLGQHILKKSPRSQAYVSAYELEGEPTEYDHEEDVLTYRFLETMSYKEFVTRFGDK